MDFVDILTERVGACDALVVVIGKNWISNADENNRRRLDNPDDYVRIEIEAALNRGVRVIPVLVDGATMPKRDDLPESLKKLARRQGIEISHNRFDSDVERLTRTLASLDEELRQGQKAEPARQLAEAARRPDDEAVQKAEHARGSARVAMGEASTLARESPKLPTVDKADVAAIRSFLPGKVFGRTAALLAVFLAMLLYIAPLDRAIESFLGFPLQPPWLWHSLLLGIPVLIVGAQIFAEWNAERSDMTSRFAPPPPTRQLEMGLAFVFGCVALAVVLWLAFRAETLSEQQFEILRIVLALAGGGVGAVIPGFLDVSMKAGAKLALRAGGALAVFIVLYFWSPAHWAPLSTGAVEQHTNGTNSPAQNGNGNSVIINGKP